MNHESPVTAGQRCSTAAAGSQVEEDPARQCGHLASLVDRKCSGRYFDVLAAIFIFYLFWLKLNAQEIIRYLIICPNFLSILVEDFLIIKYISIINQIFKLKEVK